MSIWENWTTKNWLKDFSRAAKSRPNDIILPPPAIRLRPLRAIFLFFYLAGENARRGVPLGDWFSCSSKRICHHLGYKAQPLQRTINILVKKGLLKKEIRGNSPPIRWVCLDFDCMTKLLDKEIKIKQELKAKETNL